MASGWGRELAITAQQESATAIGAALIAEVPERYLVLRTAEGPRSAVPYFQPALGRAGQRVPPMMLMVFSGAGAPAGTQHVDGRIVEGFLTEYLEECEDSLRLDDTDAQAVLTACLCLDGLPLVRISELPA